MSDPAGLTTTEATRRRAVGDGFDGVQRLDLVEFRQCGAERVVRDDMLAVFEGLEGVGAAFAVIIA
ncbi:MAG: hypothetical protein NT062_32020, partial [Proteobacteria bacterium]|nr:hypothetical protein [Pseudomonadota bacterium]